MRLTAEHVRSWLRHLMKVINNFIVPLAKERVCSGFGFGVGGSPSFFWGFDWTQALELVDKLSYSNRIKLKVWNKLVL